MDFTVLYVILAAIGVVGLVVGISWLLKKLNVDVGKMLIILDPLETILKFVKVVLIDMGIDEDELDVYSGTILDTLEYLKTLDPDIGKETRIAEGKAYCEGLLIKFGVNLTPARVEIINQVIPALWNLYYAIQETQTEVEYNESAK